MSLAVGKLDARAARPLPAAGHSLGSIRPGFKRLVLIYLWIVIATGCFVFVEPAPYDVLLPGATIVIPIAGLIALPRTLSVYLLLVCGIVAGGYVASTQAGILDVPVRHVTITLYLALSSVVLVAFVAYNPLPHARLIMSAYLAAALVASIAALIGYFNVVPAFHDVLTEFGRARGTFKDANVLGAFLVPPALYALNGMLNARAPKALLWSLALGILLLATLLTFSRGAWLNAAVGFMAFGFFAFVLSDSNRKRIRLFVLGAIASAGLIGGLVAIATLPGVWERLGERASFEQSYDLGPEGRFAGQQKAAELVASHPLGIGALEFARLHHPEDVHQVFLNMYLNTGWFGGTLYLLLVLGTLALGLRLVLRDRQSAGLTIVLLAAFLGIVIEGFVVDTNHWRHFYLIMALIWGMAASKATQRPLSGRPAVGPMPR
ncbi:MAG: O-antigen ligase family protein [Pseudomonadota bacterium]